MSIKKLIGFDRGVFNVLLLFSVILNEPNCTKWIYETFCALKGLFTVFISPTTNLEQIFNDKYKEKLVVLDNILSNVVIIYILAQYPKAIKKCISD